MPAMLSSEKRTREAMADFTHKIGDTFRARGSYVDAQNAPVDLAAAGVTIASSIKDASGIRHALSISADPDSDTYEFLLTDADTSNWYPGLAEWDVQFTDANGLRVSSDTTTFLIVRDVTQ